MAQDLVLGAGRVDINTESASLITDAARQVSQVCPN